MHDGPDRGAGGRNRYKSRLIKRLDLTADQRLDLLAFLGSLTDRDFVTNPLLADPRGGGAAHPVILD